MSIALLRRVIGGSLLVAAIMSSVLVSAAPGQELRDSTSLKFVPADTSFYLSMLRNRAQLDRVLNSKLFAHPLVQQGVAMLRAQWNNPGDPDLEAFQAILAMPENQQLVEVLKEAVATEVFVAGDVGFGRLMALVNDLNAINQQVAIEALRTGGEPSPDAAKKIMAAFAEAIVDAPMPSMLIGFQLQNTDAAVKQLGRLETVLTGVFQQVEDLKPFQSRLERQTIGAGDFVTLELDGSLIPWDELREGARNPEEIPAELWEDVIGKLKQRTLVLSVGVRENYLLLAASPTTDYLATLGNGDLLIDHEKLAPVRKHAARPVTSITYVSDAFMQNVSRPDQSIDQLVSLGTLGVGLAPVPEGLQDEIRADLTKLGDDLKTLLPKPGAVTGVSFMTDVGYEGFTHNWTENLYYDGSRPLDVLNHVGGSPLVMFAGRSKPNPAGMDILRTVVRRGLYYFDQLGVDELEPEQRDIYKQLRSDLDPLLIRLDEITTDLLLPAFADRQGALVLDAQATSKRWHESLPESDVPLPMVELGMVYGVSDRDLIVKTFTEYKSTIDTMIEKLSKALPNNVPPLQIPVPNAREFPEGTIYYYLTPALLGVDGTRFAPNAGLSEKYLAVSLMPRTTRRLLGSQPLTAGTPLADTSQPLAAASHLNWAGLVDAAVKWTDYGIDLYLQSEGRATDGGEAEALKSQIRLGASFLRCFQGATAATRVEGDAIVTHHQIRFQDLD